MQKTVCDICGADAVPDPGELAVTIAGKSLFVTVQVRGADGAPSDLDAAHRAEAVQAAVLALGAKLEA